MRVLRPVVCSQAPIVLSREPDRAERCRIGSQPVGHNPARRKAVLLKQFHHEFLCGLCIPSALDEEIQHLTLVVDRPPEPVFTAADRNHHFIEVPMIARSRPRTADIRRDRRPELQEPPPDRLVGCVNTSLGQQFLDIPKGQCEPGIEPDRVADDFWREAVSKPANTAISSSRASSTRPRSYAARSKAPPPLPDSSSPPRPWWLRSQSRKLRQCLMAPAEWAAWAIWTTNRLLLKCWEGRLRNRWPSFSRAS